VLFQLLIQRAGAAQDAIEHQRSDAPGRQSGSVGWGSGARARL
jgi:hypothetical protein